MRHKVNSQLIAEGNPKKPRSPTKQLSDSDTSDEEQINPVLKTSEEERHYRTIPSSALATQIVPFQGSSKSYSGKRTQS